MTLIRHLMQVALIATASLVICALALAYGVSLFDSQFQPVSAFGLTASGNLLLTWSLVIGAPVVLLYGVPVFVALARRGKATWLNVLGAAALPAAIAAAILPPLALFVIGFSVPIAATVRKLA